MTATRPVRIGAVTIGGGAPLARDVAGEFMPMAAQHHSELQVQLEQLAMGHGPARVRYQVAQQLELLERHLHGPVVHRHHVPLDVIRKMGELGLMGIPFPEQYGGGGADTLAYALAVEELTRIDSSVAITMAAKSASITTR